MQEIRKLFVEEHFKKIGFIDGFKYISTKTGNIVDFSVVKRFILSGVLHV